MKTVTIDEAEYNRLLNCELQLVQLTGSITWIAREYLPNRLADARKPLESKETPCPVLPVPSLPSPS